MKFNSLSFRISIGYGLMLLMLVGAIIMTMWQFNKITNNETQLREINTPFNMNALRVLSDVSQSLSAVDSWIVLGKQQFKDERDKSFKEINKHFNQLNELNLNDATKRQLKTIKQDIDDLEKAQYRIMMLAHNEENIPALLFFRNKISPILVKLDNSISKITDIEKNQPASGERKELFYHLARIHKHIAAMETSLMKYLETGNKKYLEQYQFHWNEVASQYQALGQRKKLLNKAQQLEYKKLTDNYQAFIPLVKNVILLREQTNWNRANSLLADTVVPLSEKIKKQLYDLISKEQAAMQASFLMNKEQISLVFHAGWIILGGGTLFCLMLTFALTRSITNPIKACIKVANEIGKGDLNTRVNLKGAEEIVNLGHSLENMKCNLQQAKEDYELATMHFQESELQTRAIIDNAVDGILTIDERGFIQQLNHAAQKIFQLSSIDALGKNITTFMPDFMDETGELRIKIGTYETQGSKFSGEGFPINISVAKYSVADVLYYVLLVRDISEENKTISLIEERNRDLEERNWLRSSREELHEIIRHETNSKRFMDEILKFLCQHLNLTVGTFYDADVERLHFKASYAAPVDKIKKMYLIGEGLLGQCAKDKECIFISDSATEQLVIISSIGQSKARHLMAVPILVEDVVIAAMELATLAPLTHNQLSFLEQARFDIGIALSNIQTTERLNDLLVMAQRQATDLQISEEQLQATNEALEEKTVALLHEKKAIEKKNELIQQANESIAEKVEQLEQTSRYKSEFLANMSHELRTPLNSLLLLSGGMASNLEQNLTQEQLEDIGIIHNAGKTLLDLINDILDLSKVEAGKLVINFEKVKLNTFTKTTLREFSSVSKQKNVGLVIDNQLDEHTIIHTDPMRVEQILRNLLSNAFKFTPQGDVTLTIYHPELEEHKINKIKDDEKVIAFAVQDDGLGIPESKQELIFESFQQADGGIARKHGGTGLGLAICYKLADLLHGKIDLKYSKENEGSCFVLYLPTKQVLTQTKEHVEPQFDQAVKHVTQPASNRAANSSCANPRILIVEDDVSSQKVIARLIQSHERDAEIKVVDNAQDAFMAIEQTAYDCVILDLKLPDKTGHELVIQLSQAKPEAMPPIIIYSGQQLTEEQYFELNTYAKSFVVKGLNSPQQLLEEIQLIIHGVLPESEVEEAEKIRAEILRGASVMVVDDDIKNCFAISKRLKQIGITAIIADSGNLAIEKLNSGEKVDLVLMDIMMPYKDGYETMKEIRSQQTWYSNIPIIALTAKAMSEDRKKSIDAGANDYITKPIDFDKLTNLMKVWIGNERAA